MFLRPYDAPDDEQVSSEVRESGRPLVPGQAFYFALAFGTRHDRKVIALHIHSKEHSLCPSSFIWPDSWPC